MPAPQWAAFVGLTVLIVAAFLLLARLSQSQLGSSPARVPITDRPAGVDPGVATDPPELSVATGTERPVESLSATALLANVAATQGLFGVVLAGGAIAFAVPASAFGLADPLGQLTGRPLLFGVVLGAGLWLASEGTSRVVDAAGIEHDESLRGLLAPSTAVGWLVLLGVVLPIIAGVEELVFRAAAIGAVGAGTGLSPWLLAVVSSVTFGLGHGAQGTVGVVVTGVLGLVLAAAFALTGSFVTVVVAHYLVNALEFVVHEGPWSGRTERSRGRF